MGNKTVEPTFSEGQNFADGPLEGIVPFPGDEASYERLIIRLLIGLGLFIFWGGLAYFVYRLSHG